MFRTIEIGTHALAQGTFVRNAGGGRIEIDLGGKRIIGRPVVSTSQGNRAATAIHKALTAAYWRGGLFAVTAAVGLAFGGSGPAQAQDQAEILNVSYDPTREFYREYNALFSDWWGAQGHAPITI